MIELYFFINYFPVIKTRSPGCSPGRCKISTTKCCSSNAKEVRLGLYETVIKWAHENTRAKPMQVLALQLVLIRGNLAHQKDLLPWIMTPIPPWTPSFQHRRTEYFTVASADLCFRMFLWQLSTSTSVCGVVKCVERTWSARTCRDQGAREGMQVRQ